MGLTTGSGWGGGGLWKTSIMYQDHEYLKQNPLYEYGYGSYMRDMIHTEWIRSCILPSVVVFALKSDRDHM